MVCRRIRIQPKQGNNFFPMAHSSSSANISSSRVGPETMFQKKASGGTQHHAIIQPCMASDGENQLRREVNKRARSR